MDSDDTDLTRRRLAAIPDLGSFLTNIYTYSAVGIAVWKMDGSCLLANNAFRRIFGDEPLVDYNILKDDIFEDIGIMPYLHRAFAGEVVQVPVFWYDARELKSVQITEGRRVAISMTAFPLHGGDGEQAYVAAMYQDQTDVVLAHEELQRLNVDLEVRILERTSQLAVANRELEGFAYSISHDLRTPLRAISGYSQILREEHSAQLDSDGLDYLRRIGNGAGRMGQLIDELLEFSRLGRLSMDVKSVSSLQLVEQAWEELHAERAGREVDLSLGVLPECNADCGLLKQVFINLLSNALKFTRKREHARIEVGTKDEGGERVWFVKDNGVGFDMRYAGKLFGVFQRLHHVDDYEGTGVGLSLVQRIIHRHGGHVWTESAPERGAAFFFTLEPIRRDEPAANPDRLGPIPGLT